MEVNGKKQNENSKQFVFILILHRQEQMREKRKSFSTR